MSKVQIINENFDEFIAKDVCVIDFWATWCGPCRMMAPILDQISESLDGVQFGKVDVDKFADLAVKYQISAIPNICIFKNGELVDRAIGVQNADSLTDLIKKHI